MSPTLILPSNSNIIPENTSPKIACNPNPIPTNRAAEPASKNVISIPTPWIPTTMAIVYITYLLS